METKKPNSIPGKTNEEEEIKVLSAGGVVIVPNEKVIINDGLKSVELHSSQVQLTTLVPLAISILKDDLSLTSSNKLSRRYLG